MVGPINRKTIAIKKIIFYIFTDAKAGACHTMVATLESTREEGKLDQSPYCSFHEKEQARQGKQV